MYLGSNVSFLCFVSARNGETCHSQKLLNIDLWFRIAHLGNSNWYCREQGRNGTRRNVEMHLKNLWLLTFITSGNLMHYMLARKLAKWSLEFIKLQSVMLFFSLWLILIFIIIREIMSVLEAVSIVQTLTGTSLVGKAVILGYLKLQNSSDNEIDRT